MEKSCREKIVSEDYVDFIIDFPLEDIWGEGTPRYDFCYQQVDERIGILSINKNQLPDTKLLTNEYMSFPDLLGLQQVGEEFAENMSYDPSYLVESGITRVQGAPLYLTGRGVILAFADTGINYRNRIFQREDGSTRILAVWDQTGREGNPPEGFMYGTEYTGEELNRALTEELITDENGHGTKLAALAAGSQIEGGSRFNSPAYDADIVMVKLKPAKEYLKKYYEVTTDAPAYASCDVMMAVKYLDSFARAFRRPVVFCLGVGNNFRDHEGNDIFSRYLDKIASQRSRIMVIAGGNEGNAAHHCEGEFVNSSSNSQNIMELYVSEGVNGFFMEIWTDAPVNLSVSVQTPGGESVEPVSVLFQTNLKYRFVFEETVITVYNAYITQGSGDALVLLRFENPTQGIWRIGVTDENKTKNGRFNAWLPITGFLERPVYFLEPSPRVTLTTPSYANEAITVATYDSSNNRIYPDSGRGYSRDGRIKPDLAAPGAGISLVGNRLGEVPVLTRESGSSLAAGIMAGAAAQFAQWAIVDGNSPYIRSREVKNYFIRGAVRDRNTEYPNEIWGYGKLDIYNTFVSMQNK